MWPGQQRRQRGSRAGAADGFHCPGGAPGSRQSQDLWGGHTKPPGAGMFTPQTWAEYLLCAGARAAVMSAAAV